MPDASIAPPPKSVGQKYYNPVAGDDFKRDAALARFLTHKGFSAEDVAKALRIAQEARQQGRDQGATPPIDAALIGYHAMSAALGIQPTARPQPTAAQIVAGVVDFMRFVKDPRMQPVLDQLNRLEHRASQKLASLSFVFVAASLSALGDNIRHVLPTKAERRKAVKHLANVVAPCIESLRGQAVYFREEHAAGRCDQGQAWAQAMEQAANYREHRLVESLTPRPLPTPSPVFAVIDGWPRAFMRSCSPTKARRLYGRVLYGTVATTVTVGVRLPAGEEVTIEEVRIWSKASGAMGISTANNAS